MSKQASVCLLKYVITPQIYVLFLKCQRKINLFLPRYVIGWGGLVLQVTLAARLDVNALLYQYHRLSVYPYRDSLYPWVGRDRALVLFQSHVYIIFMLFLHEYRLPVDRLASPDLTFLVKPVQLLPDFIPNLVHKVGELYMRRDDVLAPLLILEPVYDGQEVCAVFCNSKILI